MLTTAIKALAADGVVSGAQRTQKSLLKRGWMSSEGRLTSKGRVEAIATLPLAQQCAHLGIPLEVLPPQPRAAVGTEAVALAHYQARGFTGTHCEGQTLLAVLKALCLDYLGRVYFSREDACVQHFEELLFSFRHQVEALTAQAIATTPTRLRENLAELNRHVAYASDAVEVEWAARLFSAAGAPRLAATLERMAASPHLLQHGWPDLLLVKDEEVALVEVKAADKLNRNQVRTIHEVCLPAGIPVTVCKVTYEKAARPSLRIRAALQGTPEQ